MAQMPEEDLEPLITECPSCQTRFRVSDAQLKRARGRVRCGACLTVFHGGENMVPESVVGQDHQDSARHALDVLLDELTGGPASAGRVTADASHRSVSCREDTPGRRAGVLGRTPLFGGFEDAPEENVLEPPGRPPADAAGTLAVAEHEREEAAAPAPPAEKDSPAATAADPADAAPLGPAPLARLRERAADPHPSEDLVSRTAARSVTFGEVEPRRPLVWLGIVVGTMLLIAQVLWYQFDDWATRPQWRGVYTVICGILGCELPVQRDGSLLSTRNMVVRIHPQEQRALLVSAVIVNAAEFAQPFPVLELQFTTVRGNLVASRRFHPDEYLAGDALNMTLIPPRTPVQIELTIEDPGPDAVNYRLNFR